MIGIDRDVWFDESFSLETVHLMQNQTIDFSQYDVHPPGYYYMLYGWMALPHAMREHMWAREFSVMWGLLFLMLVASLLLALGFSRKEIGMVLFLLVFSTTVLYYATEIRMYIVEMALAVLAVYAVLMASRSLGKVERGFMLWTLVWILVVFLLPFLHYFGVVLYAVLLVFAFALLRKKWGNLVAVWYCLYGLAMMILAAALSFFLYALPQLKRVERLYLPSPTLKSYISSLFFSFHDVAEEVTGGWAWVLYVGFVAFIVVLLLLAWRTVKQKGKEEWAQVLLLLLALGAVLPFIGMIVGGLFNSYHHRYYLVVLWMVAVAAYALFIRTWGWKAFVPLLLLSVFITGFFIVSTDTELRLMTLWIAQETSQCPEGVNMTSYFADPSRSVPVGCPICVAGPVVHETTFTYVPFEVYRREWCRGNGTWVDWLSTNMTERLGRSLGEAVIPKDHIVRGSLGVLPAEVNGSFYFVDTQIDRVHVNVSWLQNDTVLWIGRSVNLTWATR